MGKASNRRLNSNKQQNTRGKATIRRRHHSQLPLPKKQQTQGKANDGPLSVRIKVPFTHNDNVLLVGEGDFSFASSLLLKHKPASIIATCYDTEEQLLQKYPEIKTRIARLAGTTLQRSPGRLHNGTHDAEEAFEGFSPDSSPTSSSLDLRLGDGTAVTEDAETSCQLLYGIDATKLSSTHKKVLRSFSPFSKIVFNFPHVGGLSTDVNRQVRSNQQLLVRFFNSAKFLLSSPSQSPNPGFYGGNEEAVPSKGQILVTLFEGEPYTLWNIRDLARHCGLQVVESFKFPWAAYNGYRHARTVGEITTGKDRSEEGKRKGAWRGEERHARCYVIEVRDDGGSSDPPMSSKKRRQRGDSSDEDND